jgi:hypothetical protein
VHGDYVRSKGSEPLCERKGRRLPVRRRRSLHATPPLNRLLGPDEEYIIRPLAHMRSASIKDFGAIPELVAVLVNSARKLVIQGDCANPKVRQMVKLARFRDAVVVCVLPEQQSREDGIPAIDYAVPVPAVFRLVEFGQGQEPVRLI